MNLREAAQQALNALEWYADYSVADVYALDAAAALKAALAEPKQDGCDHCNHPLYAAIKCRACGRVTEPDLSRCPNCASLEAQNTELDRKLAEMEQTSLELCETCGWRTLIPGDCCLNCARTGDLA